MEFEGTTPFDLDPTNSYSSNEVPARLLKLMAAEISPSLRLLFSVKVPSHKFGNNTPL